MKNSSWMVQRCCWYFRAWCVKCLVSHRIDTLMIVSDVFADASELLRCYYAITLPSLSTVLLFGWSSGWMVGQLVGWLVIWLDGWSSGWMVGHLVGWLVICQLSVSAFWTFKHIETHLLPQFFNTIQSNLFSECIQRRISKKYCTIETSGPIVSFRSF